jgi:putative SOS response-associated peptidase YedK
MCGRYAVTLPKEAMRDLFRTLNMVDYPARYNIAPTQPVLTIREKRGNRTMQFARWGLVPAWVKNPREFKLIINARSEGMEDKPAFRDALRTDRCIVPASGYFEWKTDENGAKQPYYITMADGSPMAFAGLYATWSGPGGEEIDSTAIVTTAAGEDTVHIHDRTPAVLRGDEIDAWLDTGSVGPLQAKQLVSPLEAGSVVYHPVDRAVGRADSEGPALIAPVVIDPNQSVPEPKKKRAAGGGGQLDLF